MPIVQRLRNPDDDRWWTSRWTDGQTDVGWAEERVQLRQTWGGWASITCPIWCMGILLVQSPNPQLFWAVTWLSSMALGKSLSLSRSQLLQILNERVTLDGLQGPFSVQTCCTIGKATAKAMSRVLEGSSNTLLKLEENTPDNSMNFRDWLRTRTTEGYKSIACYSISGWCQAQAISPFKRSNETGLGLCAAALCRGLSWEGIR